MRKEFLKFPCPLPKVVSFLPHPPKVPLHTHSLGFLKKIPYHNFRSGMGQRVEFSLGKFVKIHLNNFCETLPVFPQTPFSRPQRFHFLRFSNQSHPLIQPPKQARRCATIGLETERWKYFNWHKHIHYIKLAWVRKGLDAERMVKLFD